MRWWRCKAWMDADFGSYEYHYDCRKWAKHWGPHITTGREWRSSRG